MFKKSLIILSVILSVLFITTFSFAVNTTDTKNTISNVTDTVVDGVDRLGSDVRNGIGSVENGVEGAIQDAGNNDNNNNNNNNLMNTGGSMDDNAFTRTDTNGYTATRTDADLTTTTNNGMNSTLWTWIILAVLGVVIVALVWYYGTQNTNNDL